MTGALRRSTTAAADRFQAWNRGRKADWLRAFVATNGIRTVLIVGSDGRPGRVAWENQVERALVDVVPAVVWSSTAPDGVAGYVRADGRRLPFRDQSFDLVFSNAVIEHVGGESDQRRFGQEHRRVGRRWAMTTPNRWFPIESHTRVVLRHWSRSWRDRQTSFTRLLSRRELAALVEGTVSGTRFAPTFIAHGVGDDVREPVPSTQTAPPT